MRKRDLRDINTKIVLLEVHLQTEEMMNEKFHEISIKMKEVINIGMKTDDLFPIEMIQVDIIKMNIREVMKNVITIALKIK